MSRHRVVGLDISANRIAWAVTDSVHLSSWGMRKRSSRRSLQEFVMSSTDAIRAVMGDSKTETVCIEINLHPKVIHKGHVSPKMIRAYMRSRWVEGALLFGLELGEPEELVRGKGGYILLPNARKCYSLAATWSQNAKEKRWRRMSSIYRDAKRLGEDEIDALAIAHDCAVALALGLKG